MNTYAKYTANVWVAKCNEMHEKGNVIPVTTKHGKENNCIVFNLVSRGKDGFFYYSIVRADGFNIQEFAKKKAERYRKWAIGAENKSTAYWDAAQEGRDFLSLAEPIKVGHHSEKKHRALIDRNWNRMAKCVLESDKVKQHESKADYWNSKANHLNLSIPESLEFYEYKLEEAKMHHEGLKNGSIERSHSFSLTYAKKEVNKFQDLFKDAQKLWQ
jgi:Domain of unknown function (DUF3560)